MGFFLNSVRRLLGDEPLAAVLEPIRTKYSLPALAGAVFTVDGVVEMAAVGVRKVGTTEAVTSDDLWHLGSDAKAMTATLVGGYVAEGLLSWDATVISFFPEVADSIAPGMKSVTLSQLLNHQAGLAENLPWRVLAKTGSVSEQRLAAAQKALLSPVYTPGTYHYSNAGYVVVGALLERISGWAWEDLMRERLFRPLGMESAGFGGTGTPGQIDQPWPHAENGSCAPMNGPTMDNPPIMGPSGSVHCSMKDWTRFLTDQLRGSVGMEALLPGEIYAAMQTAEQGDYAYGWKVCERPWAGGNALNHCGSNTMNFCNCWLAPAKRFGVLVCLNQGGAKMFKASDEAATAMIQRHVAKRKSA
jgi:CubicO group peptidase (beta-lactamase class C family)